MSKSKQTYPPLNNNGILEYICDFILYQPL